jgi:CarD family transcriptional regulator
MEVSVDAAGQFCGAMEYGKRGLARCRLAFFRETEVEMELNEGKCVVYRSSEICRIMGIEQRCFDGKTEREYCILSPVKSEQSTYYVPVETADNALRELLTKEQILELIDGMDSVGANEWCDEKKDRKKLQNEILSGGEHALIIGMTRTLHSEQQKRISCGKRLSAADERAMRTAENMINSEFGFVLGISESEVGNFIRERLASR